MVNFKGELRGDTPPNRMWIVWTVGLLEPDDKWMIVTMLGLWPCMVTIIHLPEAPNCLVGPRQLFKKAVFDTFIFEEGSGGRGTKNPLQVRTQESFSI